MVTTSFVFGFLAITGTIAGLFGCLGSLNWINIPFATIGLIIGIITVTRAKEDEVVGIANSGAWFCGVALVVNLIQLYINI